MMNIDLTKGYTTIVDDDMYDELQQYKWHALEYSNQCYAARWIKGIYPRKCIRMHHQILDIIPEYLKQRDLVTDHINRNGLYNLRSNLRIVSRSINAHNSDRSDVAKFIWWDKYRDRFKVVHNDGRFIAWCKSMDQAIVVRESYYSTKSTP